MVFAVVCVLTGAPRTGVDVSWFLPVNMSPRSLIEFCILRFAPGTEVNVSWFYCRT